MNLRSENLKLQGEVATLQRELEAARVARDSYEKQLVQRR